jgi:hypothetical protein
MLPFRYVPVLIATLFFQLILVYYTSVIDYSPDIFGHLDYINRIVMTFALPDPTGWQYQQPALYYYYIAICFKLLEAFDLFDPISPLRYFSHLLYVVYCVYAIRIIEAHKNLPNHLKWLCVLFLVFWPSIQFTAVRLNNDTGFFLFYVMMFFYLQRWMHETNRDDFLRALLFASLSLMCKGTGVLSFATIGLAWCFSWKFGNPLPDILARPYRPILLACLVVLGSLSLYFGRVALYNVTHDAQIKYFANVEGSINVQKVDAKYYLSFDFINYPTDVGFIAWEKRPFWNSFLTSQIYNYFLEIYRPWIGYVLSYGYLTIFITGMASIFIRKNSFDKERLVYIAAIFSLIGGVMIQRSLTLDGHMASGRYIYPILILIILGYAHFLNLILQKNYKTIAYAGYAVAYGFILTSVFNWYRYFL